MTTGSQKHYIYKNKYVLLYFCPEILNNTVYTNQYGTYLCPAAIRDEMEKRIARRLADYPHETYFLDVYCANGTYECYSPDHPLTREQYAENMMENIKIMQSKYNQYIGSEFGADYGVPYCTYFHGMKTLQRTWFDSEINQKGTIYCFGDWSNNPSPSVMVGTHTASETYMTYSLNEYTRIPLYELVYHDAVITSWRWEDGNASCPEIWWKKDLFNILYGTAPLWSIDNERWEAFSQTYLDSFHKISPWLREIQYDEMVYHRFITPDHMIQESSFSSGRCVLVNFGPYDYNYCGKLIPSRDFLII